MSAREPWNKRGKRMHTKAGQQHLDTLAIETDRTNEDLRFSALVDVMQQVASEMTPSVHAEPRTAPSPTPVLPDDEQRQHDALIRTVQTVLDHGGTAEDIAVAVENWCTDERFTGREKWLRFISQRRKGI